VKRTLDTGTFIGEYRIERVLGQGGFGITYLAWDEDLARWVAIKEYFPRGFAHRDAGRTVTPNPDDQDRADFDWGMRHFVEEAKSLTRFRHRNIVGAIRFLRENGTAYLVMEYCDGESLEDRVKRDGALSSQELKPILDQLLDGLEEVHRANLLHLDLKPSNIFVKKDGTVVLLDFGSARQAISSHTKSVKVASAGYAALEQESADVEAGKLGAWTDIYGLGATLYRLMTGTRPQQATARVLQDGLVPLSEQTTVAHDPGLKKAVDAALSIKPQDRPKSLDEFRQALMPRPWSPAEPAFAEKTPSTTDSLPGDHSTSRWPWALIAVMGAPFLLVAAISLLPATRDLASQNDAVVDLESESAAIAAADAAAAADGEISIETPKPVLTDQTPSAEDAPSTLSLLDDVLNSGAGEPPAPRPDGQCSQTSSYWDGCEGTRTVDGATYTGYWRANKRHGQGRMLYSDGTYTGAFVNDVPEGTGVFESADGSRYEGVFLNGVLDGRGTISWKNGNKMTAEFKNGVPEGPVVYRWPNGARHEGPMLNGTFNGPGVQYAADGSIVAQGMWENGVLKSNLSDSAPQAPGIFIFRNLTSSSFYRVYISPSSASNWDEKNWLGTSVLRPNDTLRLDLRALRGEKVDIMACSAGGLGYALWNYTLPSAEITVNPENFIGKSGAC
jgi:serine/threonine protein kinase